MAKQKRPDFEKEMNSNSVLTGLVIYYDKKKNGEDIEEVLCVDCNGAEVFISKEDAVMYPYSKSLSRLVGDEVRFMVKSVSDNEYEKRKVWGSMTQAKKVLIAPIMERLKNGETLTGTVLNAVSFGAYISAGDVLGVMKNTDFTDDGGEIRDFYQRGSEIRVKYKCTSKSGLVYFLPEERKKGVSPVNVESLSVGMVILGKIVNAYPDRVFVNVLPGIDVLCFCPEKLGELRDNDWVQVKLTRIFKDEDKIMVRGKVLGKRNSGTANSLV